jgi:putative polyketide hydroxylase
MEITEVLVVGAGPGGLATAVGLARGGVDVLVVDRHPGTSPFPKATGVSTRTVELLRSWGLEDRVRAAAIPLRQLVTVSGTLVGPELGSHPTGYPSEAEARAVSPCAPCYCPQDHLEPVLAAHLQERGGRIRFRTELTGLRTDATGVTAELADRDTGRRSRVRARYLVGADGPASAVRGMLGIGVEDLGTLGDYVAATFHADLARRMPRPPSAINAVQAPVSGLFVPTDRVDRWILGHPPLPGPVDEVALIRAAAGVPDLPLRLTSVQPFTMGAHVATAFRAGRAFLVGDAAHRTTPEGGIGMNTAIHAGHNLGWKLAAVLRGRAGEALLDSYADERSPVGRAAAEGSLLSAGPAPSGSLPTAALPARTGPAAGGPRTAGPGPSGLEREMGVAYRSAVLAPDAGGRAPHAWVRHAGRRVSTLDLFDGRLTLLTGHDGGAWRAAAGRAGVTVLRVGRDLHPVDRAFAGGYDLGASGAVLVRPDGHVAWRHPGDPRDPAAAVRTAVDLALGRAPAELDLVS